MKSALLGATGVALGNAGLGLVSQPAIAATSGKFVVSDHASTLFTDKTLSYWSGWQAFGYGSLQNAFFYLQPSNSPGRGSGITAAKEHGDLRLSYVSLSGAKASTYMQLTGFGHGTTMGVESTANNSYIWMETAASAYVSGESAYANEICAIKWRGNNEVFTPSDLGTDALPSSARYKLKSGSTHNSVCFDPSTNRLVLRYLTGGKYYYAVYRLADVRAQGNSAKPVIDNIAESTVLSGVSGSYQSFTLYGDYLYVLKGSSAADCENPEDSIDSSLTSYKIDGSEKPTTVGTSAGEHELSREPEGLTVYESGSTRRLCFGIKGNETCGSAPTQHMSVFYKDEYQS